MFTNLTFHAHVPQANLVGGLLRWPPVCVCVGVNICGPLFCEDQRRVAADAGRFVFRGPVGGWTFPVDGILPQKQSLFRERGKIHRARLAPGNPERSSRALASKDPPNQEARNHKGAHIGSSGTPRRLREEAATRSSSNME